MKSDLCYILNAEDTLIQFDDHWNQFACDNDAPDLIDNRLIGTSIFNYMQGLETKLLYQQLFEKCRTSHQTITIPFRCDSPTCERHMQMEISLLANNELKILTRLVDEIPTKPKRELDRKSKRCEYKVQVCSLCKRVKDSQGQWQDLVVALAEDSRFHHNMPPELRENVCPNCAQICLGYSFVLTGDKPQQGEQKIALLIFLHGAKQSRMLYRLEAPPRLGALDEHPFSMLIASPLLPETGQWSSTDIMQIIDDLLATYAIDPSRIYLTGISLGAIEAMKLQIENPNRFAALAPISASPPMTDDIAPLTQIPLWFFHGRDDQVFRCSSIKKLVKTLVDNGGEPKLTIYPDTQHDAWSQAYHEPAFWQWLSQQRRPH